jgi:hypothetical protein
MLFFTIVKLVWFKVIVNLKKPAPPGTFWDRYTTFSDLRVVLAVV